MTRLLRIEASDAGTPTSCAPADLTGVVEHVDSAAGHRYGHLMLTNVSARTCTLNGHPGFGARGAWGNTFQNAVEHREPLADVEVTGEVALAPGEAALASLEWTGELAGAESEPISLFVVQLAQGQDAFGIPVNHADAGSSSALDIGMLTTVRVGAMRMMTTGWTETRSRPE